MVEPSSPRPEDATAATELRRRDRPSASDLPQGERPGDAIGPYRILEVVGEGGFGMVYVAEQREPVRRRVALKIVKAGMDTKEVIARFEAERQALALLDHPNVAKVLDAGATPNGRPYFAMEFVPGLPITDYCDTSKLKTRERIELFVPVCQAVQHAHQKGIIHRDLKPGNILVTLFDGKPVPKVIDFGIAKATNQALTQRTLYTETGRLMGTPEYMSPEQAGTTGLDVDTRTDIYSLGVILYQLLTGTLPFDPKTLRQAGMEGIAHILKEMEPPKPSTRLSTLMTDRAARGGASTPTDLARAHGADVGTLVYELKGDLDWITLKAMEKERSRRYETANALAMDLKRYLNNEMVLARPPSVGYRLSKFVRRYKAAAAAAFVITLVLIVGCAIATIGLIQARRANEQLKIERQAADTEREKAQRARDQAEAAFKDATHARDDTQRAKDQTDAALKDTQAAKEEAEYRAYIASIAAAAADLRYDDGVSARRRLEQAPERLRGWEWHLLWNDADQSVTTPLDFHAPGKTWQAELSPDGSLLATRLAPDKDDLVIREVRTDKETQRIKVPEGDTVERLKFSADNRLLTFYIVGTGPRLVELKSGRQFVPPEAQTQGHRVLAVDSTGTNIVLAPPGRTTPVRIVRADGWSEVCSLQTGARVRFAQNAEFSPNGRYVALSGSAEDPFAVYDAHTGVLVRELVPRSRITTLAWSADGVNLGALLEGTSNVVRIWDTATWAQAGQTPPLESRPQGMAFIDSYSGRRLVLGGARTVRLWSLEGQQVAAWRGHDGPVASIAVGTSENDGWLFSISNTGVVKKWDLTRPTSIVGSVTSIVPSTDGSLLAIGFEAPMTEHIAALYDPLLMQRLASFHYYPPDYNAKQFHAKAAGISFSPDGESLLAGSGATGKHVGRFKVFDINTGQGRFTTSPERPEGRVENGRNVVLPHDDNVTDATYSPDGLIFATASLDKTIKLWNARTFQQSGVLAGHEGAVNRIVFSPDGSRLASASNDTTARLWELGSGRVVATLTGHAGPVNDAAFTRDGKLLLTAADDGTVRIWDAKTGGLNAVTEPHGGRATCLAISPDGRRVASGSDDRTVKIWDTATWREVASLSAGGESGVRCLAFMPDGLRLLVWTPDRGLVIWDAAPVHTRAEERRVAVSAERIAEPVVRQLLDQTADHATVRRRLDSDGALSASVRHAAVTTLFKKEDAARQADKDSAQQWVWAAMTRRFLQYQIVTNKDQTPIEEHRAAMIAQIKADPGTSPIFKESAIELAAAYWSGLRSEPLAGSGTVNHLRELVRNPSSDPDLQRRARRMLESFVNADSPPGDRLLLGLARYRDGDFTGALSPPSGLAGTPVGANPVDQTGVLFAIMARHRSGETAQATADFERLLAVIERQPEAADENLGAGLAEAAHEIGGLDAVRAADDRLRRSLGGAAGAVAGIESAAAQYLLAAGLFEQAESIAARSAADLRNGGTEPALANPLQFRGAALNSLKRYAEAEAVLREALEIRERRFGRWDWRTCETRSMLGEALAAQAKYTEAEPLLVDGYTGWVMWPFSNYTRRRNGLERIVHLYEVWGKAEKAAEWAKRRADYGASSKNADPP